MTQRKHLSLISELLIGTIVPINNSDIRDRCLR